MRPGADPNVDNLLEGVDDEDDRDLDGAIDGESVQRVDVKRKFLDMQDECRVKEQRASANVAEVVDLAQELLQSGIGVNDVSSWDVLIATDGDVTTLAAYLDKAKVRILDLESMETIAVRWIKEVLEEVQERQAEEFGV